MSGSPIPFLGKENRARIENRKFLVFSSLFWLKKRQISVNGARQSDQMRFGSGVQAQRKEVIAYTF